MTVPASLAPEKRRQVCPSMRQQAAAFSSMVRPEGDISPRRQEIDTPGCPHHFRVPMWSGGDPNGFTERRHHRLE